MRSIGYALAAALAAAPLAAQGITYQSKDSVEGVPKHTAFTNVTIWFSGFVDFYGLQGVPTFSPIEIPTDGTGDDAGTQIGADLRQTRIRLGYTNNGTPIGPITAYVEGDFWGPDGTTVFRLRRAYVTARRLLIGQEWSSFSDLSNFPPVADFDGPPTGANVRVAMIQYRSPRTAPGWSTQVSLENPSVDLRYAGAAPDTTFELISQPYPNLAANARLEGPWGHVQLAGLVLGIRYAQGDTAQTELGYGGAVSAVIKVGARDELYLQGLAGKGISRYVTGLGNANADVIVYNGELSTLPVTGGYLAYQHFWTPRWYSTGVVGGILVENDIDPAFDDLFRGAYTSLNLFYEPAPRLNLGTELLYGWNKDPFGGEGDALRLYLIMNYTP